MSNDPHPIDLYGDGELVVLQVEALKSPEDAAQMARLAMQYADRIEQITAMVNAELDRLRGRHRELVGPLQEKLDQCNQLIENWHRANRAANPDTPKTIHFPTGAPSTLKAKPVKVDPESLDHGKLRAFVDGLPDHVERGRAADLVYQEPAPLTEAAMFRISELLKFCEWGPKGEPGEPVSLIVKGTGEVVPGIAGKYEGDVWNPGKVAK